MVAEAALPMDDALTGRDEEESTNAAREITSGGGKVTQWEVVAVADGLAQAAIIQGRLESEGIPTQVRQEPAGVAIGLTVGALGQAKILVPEPLVEEALQILEPGDYEDEESDDILSQ
jgi:hypothetical protein